MVDRKSGRVATKLAAKLQATMPERVFKAAGGETRRVPLLWKPENLYPATGAYRTNGQMDCCRWEGCVLAVRADGTTYPHTSVHSYETMTDLIRPGGLSIGADGEVTRTAPR